KPGHGPVSDVSDRSGDVAQFDSKDLLSEASRSGQEYLREHATHRAARGYAVGLIIGVVVSLGLLAVIALLSLAVDAGFTGLTNTAQGQASSFTNVAYVLQFVLVCIGGGAMGATVSAMLRLRSERINYESAVVRGAILRIVLGWCFAAALFFLV